MITRLYQMYSREIFLYLYSMCRDAEAAEDMTQECFLRAILSLPEEHGNMRAWLYRVARNILYDSSRGKRAELSLDAAEKTIAADSDPLDIYLQSEDRRKLLRLIAGLDKRKREILTLQYFSGLSQKEIAALLRISHENVRVLSLRARRELKKKLEEDDNNELS